jgi:uncharacterized membrane protein
MKEEDVSGASDNNGANDNNSDKLFKEASDIPLLDIQKLNLENSRKTRIVSSTSMYSGPFPPPELLKAYDSIEPGLARQLFDMVQKQSQHRIKMEETVIVGDSKRSWLGLILGFIIAMTSIGSSTYLILQGHDIAGGIIGSGTLATLVGTFVYGSNKRSEERIEKQKVIVEESQEK